MSKKKRFLLRLDPKLYETLERWSADELRSVNAQIEYLLTQAAHKAGRLKENKHNKRSQLPTQSKSTPEPEETPEDIPRPNSVQPPLLE
ncbi:hypothetical protein H6F98_05860 [Microcoleus sp. FACHB-SPT15]|uniref:hypothetical protein n=1 Tax=Microcoleus sp. FACHB-SPT15 TaxID=2692830 RepID=UPI00177A96E6|nr:hypothetical protein [Microcoleus sp. FACHB-SPT15]MBD1804976.1 hypothetical protein [Microcoleus sp. FACHB-SPT15]